MRYLFLSLLCLLIANALSAQKPKTYRVKVKEQWEVPKGIPADKVQYDLLNHLKKQAIENEFGSHLISAKTIQIESENKNGEISGGESLNAVAKSHSRGIWVRTTAKQCELRYQQRPDGPETWVHCTLEGEIQEAPEFFLDLVVQPMSCLEDGCERTDFNDLMDLFLKLRSPVDGYAIVFLEVIKEDIVQCLQPVPGGKAYSFDVAQDKDLILFKNAGYQMYTDYDIEVNILHVIFSKTPFDKPILREKGSLSPQELEEGITFPKELKSQDFENWLGGLRARYKDIQVEAIPITIKK